LHLITLPYNRPPTHIKAKEFLTCLANSHTAEEDNLD